MILAQSIHIAPCSTRLLCILFVTTMLIAHMGCTGSRTEKSIEAEAPAAEAEPGDVAGRYMSEQASKLANLEGATSAHIGKEIKVTWSSSILFDLDSAMLRIEAQESLTKMAAVLSNYPDTDILITGHTDSTGAEAYNLKLSERRAQSLATFLTNAGITPARVNTLSEAGRLLIDHVEIQIRPNDDLRARTDQLLK